MSNQRQDKTFLKGMAIVAPAFAAKAVVADMPKAMVENVLEKKLQGSPSSTRMLAREAVFSKKKGFGKATGRAIGGMAGVVTAPLFLRGVQLSSSDNSAERKRGLAYLGASGGAYAALKGYPEIYMKSTSEGFSKTVARSRALEVGVMRGLIKSPIAVIGALGIAKGRRDAAAAEAAGGKKKSRYVAPAIIGALLGGLTRGAEHMKVDALPAERKLQGSIGRAFPGALRKSMPSIAGGAAGGLLGGLVLSGITNKVLDYMKGKEKKSSIEASYTRLYSLM